MSVTGEPGGPPVKVGVPLTDLGAGLFALSAILAALHYRTRTGRGQYIDTSLVDAGVALSVWEATEFFSGGVVPQPTGSAHRFSAPYQAIRCADGYITLAAANQRLFERLTVEYSAVPSGSRIPDLRATARACATVRCLRNSSKPRPSQDRGALAGAVRPAPDPVRADQQLRAGVRRPSRAGAPAGRQIDHPTLGPLRTLGSALKMSETPPVVDRRAPLLGEHTEQVLRELDQR